MFTLTINEIYFIGLCLEGLLYGLYSGIFAMYIQYHASKKDTNTQKIIFYSICALYVSSAAVFACDIAGSIFHFLSKPPDSLLPIAFIQMTLFGCCDFIAQFILIYRCWIVWGRDIRVVIIPSASAFAFLVIWLAGGSSTYIFSDDLVNPGWVNPTNVTSLALSLAVNALVTGLIVFRIFRVFREVKVTSDGQNLGATGGSNLRRIIFVLIESGMALFSIQLTRLMFLNLPTSEATGGDIKITCGVINIIDGIHEMLNGITPTIILVRISMGLSFDNEKSMEEVAIGTLRFASNHPNSVPETGSVTIVGQDHRNDDEIDIRRSNDIEVVER